MKPEEDGWSRRLRKPRLRGGLTSEERHLLISEERYRVEHGFRARGDRGFDRIETEQEVEERRPPGS